MFEPWQRARISSQHPLYAHLINRSQLFEGDTIEIASRIFPTLSYVERNSDDRIRFEQAMAFTGETFPEDADLYRYQSHGVVGMLTFQNGKLVMSNSDDDPIAVAQRRLITPSLWFRSGILPIYTLIASLLLAAWALFGRRYQSPNNNKPGPGQEASVAET